MAVRMVDRHDALDPIDAIAWWGKEHGTFCEVEEVEGCGDVVKATFNHNGDTYELVAQLTDDEYCLVIQIVVHEFVEQPDIFSLAVALNALTHTPCPFVHAYSYDPGLSLLLWRGSIVTDADSCVTIDQVIYVMENATQALDRIGDIVAQFTGDQSPAERALRYGAHVGSA